MTHKPIDPWTHLMYLPPHDICLAHYSNQPDLQQRLVLGKPELGPTPVGKSCHPRQFSWNSLIGDRTALLHFASVLQSPSEEPALCLSLHRADRPVIYARMSFFKGYQTEYVAKRVVETVGTHSGVDGWCKIPRLVLFPSEFRVTTPCSICGGKGYHVAYTYKDFSGSSIVTKPVPPGTVACCRCDSCSLFSGSEQVAAAIGTDGYTIGANCFDIWVCKPQDESLLPPSVDEAQELRQLVAEVYPLVEMNKRTVDITWLERAAKYRGE